MSGHAATATATATENRGARLPWSAPALCLVTTSENSAKPALDDPREGCPNWRRGYRIELPDGRQVPVRCKSPNKCPYCGMIAAIQNAAVLDLDARTWVEGVPRFPTVLVTLTTRKRIEGAAFTRATADFWRAFRATWGWVEYCGFVEWTTGTAKRAAGVRRMHTHNLVKDLSDDVPVADVERWARGYWKRLTGAWVVEVVRLHKEGGATAYLSLHHRKRAQGPPRGWSGQRFRPSNGYFNAPIAQLRKEAALQLAEAAAVRDGRDPADVRLAAVMDFMRGRIVPAAEADGHCADAVGDGLTDQEWDVFVLAAADGAAREGELERLERVYAEAVKRQARRRMGAVAQARMEARS